MFASPLLLVIGLMGSFSGLRAQEPVRDYRVACSASHLTTSAKVDGYVFRSYRDSEDGGACMQVLRDGKVIFRRTNDNGGHYELGQAANKDAEAPAIADGTDITGRGHPDMIVKEWTGGAHCCLIAYVFELDPVFRLVARLDAEDDSLSHFEDTDGDGRFYYRTTDWTFAYWPQSFAGSPSVQIALRFVDDAHGGSYHLALDKMSKPVFTAAEWQNKVANVRGFFDDPVWVFSGELWQSLLELIYSGQPAQAWKLVDQGWPRQVKGKLSWLRDFCGILKTSPYFHDLEHPFDGAPEACVAAHPHLAGQ